MDSFVISELSRAERYAFEASAAELAPANNVQSLLTKKPFTAFAFATCLRAALDYFELLFFNPTSLTDTVHAALGQVGAVIDAHPFSHRPIYSSEANRLRSLKHSFVLLCVLVTDVYDEAMLQDSFAVLYCTADETNCLLDSAQFNPKWAKNAARRPLTYPEHPEPQLEPEPEQPPEPQPEQLEPEPEPEQLEPEPEPEQLEPEPESEQLEPEPELEQPQPPRGSNFVIIQFSDDDDDVPAPNVLKNSRPLSPSTDPEIDNLDERLALSKRLFPSLYKEREALPHGERSGLTPSPSTPLESPRKPPMTLKRRRGDGEQSRGGKKHSVIDSSSDELFIIAVVPPMNSFEKYLHAQARLD